MSSRRLARYGSPAIARRPYLGAPGVAFVASSGRVQDRETRGESPAPFRAMQDGWISGGTAFDIRVEDTWAWTYFWQPLLWRCTTRITTLRHADEA
jgi:hypothetical protein